MKIFFLLLFMQAGLFLHAQECKQWPADCPDNGSIEAGKDRSVRLGNGLLSQEIDMQDRMRNLAMGMMQHAAAILRWQMAELDEITNLNPLQSSTTPSALRSPRAYGITFQFVANEDSLNIWRDWSKDFANRYQNAGSRMMSTQNDIYKGSLYKQYNDSINHYLKLRTDYYSAHPNETHFWDDKQLVYLQQKQDEFTNKLTALINNNQNGNSIDDLEKEKILRTQQFHNASIVQIFFDFNAHIATTNGSDEGAQVSNYTQSNTSLAKSVHLSHADSHSILWHFDQWENMVVLMLGNWITKADSNKNYKASFVLNGQDDEHTPKKIESDKVQTICIHVIGSKVNMDKLIQQLDIKKLNEVIDKK